MKFRIIMTIVLLVVLGGLYIATDIEQPNKKVKTQHKRDNINIKL